MTGTGTETDPYIIENEDDFITMTLGKESSMYYSLSKPLDFTSYRQNQINVVKYSSQRFKGNNHLIKHYFGRVTPSPRKMFYDYEGLVYEGDADHKYEIESKDAQFLKELCISHTYYSSYDYFHVNVICKQNSIFDFSTYSDDQLSNFRFDGIFIEGNNSHIKGRLLGYVNICEYTSTDRISIKNITMDGDKTHPYNVGTVNEFTDLCRANRGVLKSGFGNVYINITQDLDFNKSEFWKAQSIPLRAISIDGNGHKFKNIYAKNFQFFYNYHYASSMGPILHLKNIIFEGVLINTSNDDNSYGQTSLLRLSDYDMLILNCEFRLKIYAMYDLAKIPTSISCGNSYGSSNQYVVNNVFNLEIYFSGNSFNNSSKYHDASIVGGLAYYGLYFINNEIKAKYVICEKIYNPKSTIKNIFLFNEQADQYYGYNYIENNAFFLDLDIRKLDKDEIVLSVFQNSDAKTNYNSIILNSLKKADNTTFTLNCWYPSTTPIITNNIVSNRTGIPDNIPTDPENYTKDVNKINYDNTSANRILSEANIKNSTYLKEVLGFPIV